MAASLAAIATARPAAAFAVAGMLYSIASLPFLFCGAGTGALIPLPAKIWRPLLAALVGEELILMCGLAGTSKELTLVSA